MQMVVAHDRTRPARFPWPFPPLFLPFWYVYVGWSWWKEIRDQLENVSATGLPLADALAPGAAAFGVLGGRLFSALLEAAFYVLCWRSRGARLPYWRMLGWILSLSLADLFGLALVRAAGSAPGAVQLLCALLAGPAALRGSTVAESGWEVAFAGFGLLAVLRIGMTAWAQARGTGQSHVAPMMLTAGVWLATRLAAWWTFDLVRGLSPAP